MRGRVRLAGLLLLQLAANVQAAEMSIVDLPIMVQM
jgi:hypothetical protein